MFLPLSSHSILHNPGPGTDSTELLLYPRDRHTHIPQPCSSPLGARQPPPPAPEDAPEGRFASYSSCFKTPFVIYPARLPRFLTPSDIGTAAPERLAVERGRQGRVRSGAGW